MPGPPELHEDHSWVKLAGALLAAAFGLGPASPAPAASEPLPKQ